LHTRIYDTDFGIKKTVPLISGTA